MGEALVLFVRVRRFWTLGVSALLRSGFRCCRISKYLDQEHIGYSGALAIYERIISNSDEAWV